jgi:L-iditol 2-dehydrogenase
MRAVRCCDGKVEVVDVPRMPEEGVRVRVRSAGICGSDLHLIRGGYPLTVTLGHEFAGELDDGRHVAVEPLVPCGSCDFCLEKRFNLCRRGTSILMGVERDGGMTDEVWVPERCIVPLAENVSSQVGCLVEPLAVAMHGVRKAGIRSGERVAVVGAGSIGLSAVAAAQSLGAQVDLIARHDQQRKAGDALGAGLEVEGEYRVVIDCAGTPDALNKAAFHCLPGGTLLMLSTPWDGMTLPAMTIFLKEIACVPSSMYSHDADDSDFEAAARMLASRPEIPEVLINHRLDLDAAPNSFEFAVDCKAGAILVVLVA